MNLFSLPFDQDETKNALPGFLVYYSRAIDIKSKLDACGAGCLYLLTSQGPALRSRHLCSVALLEQVVETNRNREVHHIQDHIHRDRM